MSALLPRLEWSRLLEDPHVHQAVGMVSVQLDISVADAEVRLRAYALVEVAQEVVARRLCIGSG